MSKKKAPAKSKAIVPVEQPVPATTVKPVEEKVEGSWEWTPEREQALDGIFEGKSQSRIAEELGVHRNTIGNWMKHPEFLKKLEELSTAQRQTVRMRRIQQTNTFTERVARQADIAMKDVESHPQSVVAQERARGWFEEFREFREQERIDAGENVQKHEISGMVGHVHGSVRNGSFKDFLKNAIEKNVIDVEAIEADGEDAGDVVKALVQSALREGDILDVITEEDRQQALEEGNLK